MIPGVTEKEPIADIKLSPAACETLCYKVINTNFPEYRRYPRIVEVNAGADYSFERALYISILQFKVLSRLSSPNLPIMSEYVGTLRDHARGVEKHQENTKLYIPDAKAYDLMNSLEKLLNSVSGSTDIVTLLTDVPYIDYLMVMLTRKIIKSQGSLKQSQTVFSCTDKIVVSNEAFRCMEVVFRVVFKLYHTNPDFKEPPLQNAVYFGIVDGLYFSFYTYKSKPVIKLKEERDIKLTSVSEIKRQEPTQNLGVSMNMTGRSMIGRPSINQSMLITSERCDLCNRQTPQDECLNSNFKRFCKACIIHPQVDLSMIPQALIRKFVNDHRLEKQMPIECPDCRNYFTIFNYDHAKKPSIVRCSKCSSLICVKHNLNSLICFCMCKKCNMPTYLDDRLRLKLCLKCKGRYCQNCKDSKCTCRCSRCLELERDFANHKCELDKVCHECLNSFKNMIRCSCGGQLCRNCALPRIETTGDKISYRCPYK